MLGGFVAQAYAAEDKLEEVQVTGSRIVRRDLTSNSPLVSIDSAVLESRTGLNVESYLNDLPQFNPAGSPVTTQSDVQITAVNSVGIASVSLRGFGPNRSLVLVDGRRATPNNALMVVDVNSIPSSMIKRVEIISGGASAVYGADAIGGVSNFILRRDFTGLEVDAQYGVTEAGDGGETRASAIMGTKIADGRGNMVFSAEYYNRDPAFQRNREFFQKGYSDPTVPGNFIGFIMGMNGYNPVVNPYLPSVLGQILGKPASQVVANGAAINSGPPFFGALSAIFAGVRFNPNGSIFDPAGNNASTFGKPIDGQVYALQNTYDSSMTNPGPAGTPPNVVQTIKYNDLSEYASAPQTRYAFMGAGDYDITDHIKFSTSARFSQSLTKTFLAGTNASYGWEATVPYNATKDSPIDPTLNLLTPGLAAAVIANPSAYANPNFIAHGKPGAQHPVPVALALLLNSRNTIFTPSPLTTGWVAETYPDQGFAQRATTDTSTSWMIDAGVKFDIPVKDWTGEVYYSRGESSTYNVAFGDNSLARWRAEVAAPDYGANSNLQSNSTGASPNFGSVAVHCTSGFYNTLFAGDTPASADCQAAVAANLQTHTAIQQDIGELNFQGGLFDLPAGEMRGAWGYQYRRNAVQFNPDILQSTSSSQDQVIGVYPTGYLDQEIAVKDYYGELLVPVVSGLKFMKKLELDLGGRYSEYDKTASTTTFKANVSAEFNDYVRFRGGFNRATRAPNLGELYLNLQQIFTIGTTYGDPCGTLSNSPFGAGGAAPNLYPTGVQGTLAAGQTAAGAKSAYLICQAQMGAAANYFYGGAANQPAATGGTFNWVNQQGNSNLKSETSDTWTAGFVLRSPSDNAWLRGLTATFDWYKISIANAIEPYSIDYARYLCYGAVQVTDAVGAAAQAASQACQNLPRNQSTGTAVSTLLQYANQAQVSTSGVDFGINWYSKLADLGAERLPGGIGLSVQGTWLDSYKTKTSPAGFDPTTEWKGSLGPNLSGFNGGAYTYRLFTSLTYMLPSTSVSLRWRHLPGAVSAAQATQDAIVKNNASVSAGGAGTLLSYTPTTSVAAPAYDTLDLSANWNINDTYSVRAGIDNVLNTQPAITGASKGYPVGTNLAGVCNGAPGCQNPTAYSLASTGAGLTNAGFYDVLGRRFFLGFKAKF